MTFVERIGGVLASPRRTFARLTAGEARASDVAWLMVAWLVAGYLPDLVRCVLLARAFDVPTGLQLLLKLIAQALLQSILGVLLAGLVLSLFLPRQRARRVDAFDLAAYAWIPYLTVQLGGTLIWSALGLSRTARAQNIADAIGVAWALAAWACALAAALSATEPSEPTEPEPKP
jgi:hypothetical protein